MIRLISQRVLRSLLEPLLVGAQRWWRRWRLDDPQRPPPNAVAGVVLRMPWNGCPPDLQALEARARKQLEEALDLPSQRLLAGPWLVELSVRALDQDAEVSVVLVDASARREIVAVRLVPISVPAVSSRTDDGFTRRSLPTGHTLYLHTGPSQRVA